jgi:hypothetical protein
MALDPVINFGKVEVSTGYDASAVTIVLTTGEGASLPALFPYNLVWWNSTDYDDPSDDPNVEIVRCTARATDTLTVTRAQESTSATTKNTAGKTYKMILAVTKKMIDDIGGYFDGTNAFTKLKIANGTVGAGAADMVKMGSEDNGAGNASWLLQPELGAALRYGNNILDTVTGDLILGAYGVTGFLINRDGNHTSTSLLDAPTGNEAAFSFNYTTNKAAGNDTGLRVNKTIIANPGTSLLLDLQVGGASRFSVDQLGFMIFGGSDSSIAYRGGGGTAIIFQDGGASESIYARDIRLGASWSTLDSNDPGIGGIYANRIKLPQVNEPSTPTMGFGNGDTGVYEETDDVLVFVAGTLAGIKIEENASAIRLGFYSGTTPVAQQTGVAVTTAAIHAALVNLGLITA